MTPSDLRAFLKARGEATRSELAVEFRDQLAGQSPELLDDLLAWWIAKGKVEAVTLSCGQSCCRNACTTVYRWREGAASDGKPSPPFGGRVIPIVRAADCGGH